MHPLVVKFGGSLIDCASSLVPILAAAPRPVLVIPGGGPFAEAVRALNPPNPAAHWMACAAMEQVGMYLAALGLPATVTLRVPETPSVLLPYLLLRDRDPLAHSWRVSSDTIAAWCAAELDCGLLLAKSVDGIVADGRLLETLTAPVETDTVDPCFVPFALSRGIRVLIVNARIPGRLACALRNEDVPGTRLDPSLFVDQA